MNEPGRVVLGSYRDYESAERAVDALSDQGVDVTDVAIIASDLRMVEHVTGRQTWATAAGAGSGSGALTGGFLGFLFGLFSIVDPLVSGLALAFYGLIIGAVIGAVLGLATHAASGGRRDFRSFRNLEAAKYEVVADAEIADAARNVLQGQRVGAGR